MRKNERGFYKPTDKVVSTGAFARDAIIRQFQLKCIESARFALMKNRRQPERILTNTISISEEGYKRLEKHLQKFCSEVRPSSIKTRKKPTGSMNWIFYCFPDEEGIIMKKLLGFGVFCICFLYETKNLPEQ